MKLKLKEVELQLEQPTRPWQVIYGEGKTWIILRCKYKIPEQEISELGQLSVVSNDCQLLTAKNNLFYYNGIVRLTASYRGDNNPHQNAAHEGIVYDEQEARKQLSDTKWCPLQAEGKEPKVSGSSIFPSQLYLEPSLSAPTGNNGFSIWQIELPWQGWLQGGELEGKPEIVVAHLGQIGLNTLLCEVLLCLTTRDDNEQENIWLNKNSYLVSEEAAFIIPGQFLTEVVGSVVQRAFFQLKPERKTALEMEHWAKVYLIFLGSNTSGEKILTAWGLIANKIKIPYNQENIVPVFISNIKQDKISLVRVSEQKVIVKAQTLFSIEEKPQVDITTEDIAPLAENKEDRLNVAVSSSTVLAYRPRPGQKWLNKKEKKGKAISSQRKVMTIKYLP